MNQTSQTRQQNHFLIDCVLRWSCIPWGWLFIGALIIIYLKTRYPSPFSTHSSSPDLYCLTSCTITRSAVTCYFTASPAECRAGGFAAEHVRGHGAEAYRPADGAGGLRASPQGRHAASSWEADPTTGGECLQKLCECLMALVLAVRPGHLCVL